jgi:hypothetical protein
MRLSGRQNVTKCADAGGRSVLAARFRDVMLTTTTVRILYARHDPPTLTSL